MCLIFLALNHHPRYKLVVAANRDEFYQRKTAPASYWQDHPHILAGRDLEASGTWLGVTRHGKISLLTNFRDPKNIRPDAPTRGKLVSDFLQNGQHAEEYLTLLEPGAHRYNGFNLMAGTADELWYFSNYGTGKQKLAHGFFGLSNHLLDTPWPKVVRGKDKIGQLLTQVTLEPAELFHAMYDEGRAADGELPDTGIGLERERALSSMFIKTSNYGSRCSTVVLVDHDNEVTFAERVYDLRTFAYTDRVFRFKVST